MDDTRSKSGISANLVIGILSIAWSAIIAIVSIRWFVQLLGIEAYGLIGFFATLQAAISILDLGLGSTVNREVARGVALGDLTRVNRLIHSLQALYAIVALLIGGAIFVGAPFIARHWLGASSLDHHQVEWSIRLMGLVAAVRWPIGLFQGTLIGLQRARISYVIVATMATLSNVGAIVLLYAVHPSLWTYFSWQVVCAFLSLYWMRSSAWRELGTKTPARYDPHLLRTLIGQSIMISGVAVSGLLLSQLDKLVVSSSAPLADFGRYSIAGLLASALVIILIPAFNVIYPRMSGLVAADKRTDLVEFYRLGTRVLLCALIPISASAFFYSYDLLYVWTGNAQLSESTAQIVRLLIVGSTLNGIMHFPYSVQLATGNERVALFINVFLIAIALPVMVVLASRYGIIGGAVGWVIQQSLYFIVGVAVTHRLVLKGLAGRWLAFDVLPAIVMGLLLIGAGHAVAMELMKVSIARLAFACPVAIAGILIIALSRGDTRQLVMNVFRQRTGIGNRAAGPETESE